MSPQFLPESQSFLSLLIGWGSVALSWIEDHDGLAVWLQAFFSVLAIWIAIMAAGKARTREADETMQNVAAMLEHAAGYAGLMAKKTGPLRGESWKVSSVTLDHMRALSRRLDEVPLIQLRPAQEVRDFIEARNAFDQVINLTNAVYEQQDEGVITDAQFVFMHTHASDYKNRLSSGAGLLAYTSVKLRRGGGGS